MPLIIKEYDSNIIPDAGHSVDQSDRKITILKRESADEPPKFMLIVLYNEKGIYLSKRIDPRKDMYGLWQTPGGKVEENETSTEAAIQETEEETGIILPRDSLIFLLDDCGCLYRED